MLIDFNKTNMLDKSNIPDRSRRVYRAIMLDVDGTIMRNTEKPNDAVIKAIKAAVKQGIVVSIITGREVRGFEKVNEYLGLTAPVVLANGARVYDPVEKKDLRTQYVIPHDAQRIIAHLWETQQPFQVYAGGQEYISDSWEAFYPLSQTDGAQSAVEPRKRIKFSDEVVRALDFERITRIFWDVHAGQIANARHFLHGFPQIDFSVVRLMGKYYENGEWRGFFITHGEATKQHGLLEVAKYLKIDPHDMIGMGDDENDYPLLMACGLKVAMGNAVQSLKDIADYVAPSVEEDGVAHVIEKFLLHK